MTEIKQPVAFDVEAGAQWVRRPEGQGGAPPAPSVAEMQHAELFVVTIEGKHFVWSGYFTAARMERVARWSADGITWYSRTPATAGGWTASSVEACVGQRILCEYEGPHSPSVLTCTPLISDAVEMAADLNRRKVTAYLILPPVEAQP